MLKCFRYEIKGKKYYVVTDKKIANKKEDLINYIQYIDAILKNLTEVSQQIIINEKNWGRIKFINLLTLGA